MRAKAPRVLVDTAIPLGHDVGDRDPAAKVCKHWYTNDFSALDRPVHTKTCHFCGHQVPIGRPQGIREAAILCDRTGY